MQKGNSAIVALVGVFIGLLILIALLPFTIVDSTERALILHLGKIDRVVDAGIHWVTPLTESVVTFDISTQKTEVTATAASKDLQDVAATVAVQYAIQADKIDALYREYRKDVQTSVIDPAIQDAIKAATAAYTAEQLITQRVAVKDAIKTTLIERLGTAYVTVQNVDIVNFNFSESFNFAIEQKVTAEQQAQKAKNDLARVEFEAQQQIERAKAEAEAIKIQAEAITQQGGKDYVQLKAIEKWDGQLPNQFVPGSAVPFINL